MGASYCLFCGGEGKLGLVLKYLASSGLNGVHQGLPRSCSGRTYKGERLRWTDDATGRREHTPGAKAPFGSGCVRAEPEGLAYLEANASAEANAKASAKATARARKNAGVSPLRRQIRRLRSRWRFVLRHLFISLMLKSLRSSCLRFAGWGRRWLRGRRGRCRWRRCCGTCPSGFRRW